MRAVLKRPISGRDRTRLWRSQLGLRQRIQARRRDRERHAQARSDSLELPNDVEDGLSAPLDPSAAADPNDAAVHGDVPADADGGAFPGHSGPHDGSGHSRPQDASDHSSRGRQAPAPSRPFDPFREPALFAEDVRRLGARFHKKLRSRQRQWAGRCACCGEIQTGASLALDGSAKWYTIDELQPLTRRNVLVLHPYGVLTVRQGSVNSSEPAVSSTLRHPSVDELWSESERGFSTHAVSAVCMWLCKTCHAALERKSRPLCALVTAPFPSLRVPDELQGLTPTEKQLICAVRCVISIYRCPSRIGQFQTRGNAIHVWQDVEAVARQLPHRVEGIFDRFHVLRPRRKPDGGYVLAPFVVRREKVRQALKYLKEHRRDIYSRIELDEAALAELPENGIPDAIAEKLGGDDSTACSSDECSDDDQDEVVDPREAPHSFPHTGMFQDSVHGDVADNIAEEFGVRIDVPRCSQPANEYETRGLLALSMLWLFPDGLGDINEPDAAGLSRRQYFSHLLQFHSRFQSDPLFLFLGMNMIQRQEAAQSSALIVQNHATARQKRALDLLMSSTFSQAARRPRSARSANAPAQAQARAESTSTAADVEEQTLSPSEIVRSCEQVLSKASQKRKGTQAWKKRGYQDVRAYMLARGWPSVFVTLSSADDHWEETWRMAWLRGCLDAGTVIQNEDFQRRNESTWSERQRILIDNPVDASFAFVQRFEVTLSELICPNNGGVFGVVEGYAFEAECQKRGSLHVHGLLWLRDAPEPLRLLVDRTGGVGVSSEAELDEDESGDAPAEEEHREECTPIFSCSCPESGASAPGPTMEPTSIAEITAFADRILNAVIPELPDDAPQCGRFDDDNISSQPLNTAGSDAEIFEELALLMRAWQMHDCLAYCRRKRRNETVCRFGFHENLLRGQTELSYANGRVRLLPRRTINNVNACNPYLALLWRANTDCQLLVNPFAAAVYVTKYVFKGEGTASNLHRVLREGLEVVERRAGATALSGQQKLHRLCLSATSGREITQQEASCIVQSYPMRWRSFVVDSLFAQSGMVLTKQRDGRSQASSKLWLDYAYRDPRLERTCAYGLFSEYLKKAAPRSLSDAQFDFESHHPNASTHALFRRDRSTGRAKDHIVETFVGNYNPDNKSYCTNALTLFSSWRYTTPGSFENQGRLSDTTVLQAESSPEVAFKRWSADGAEHRNHVLLAAFEQARRNMEDNIRKSRLLEAAFAAGSDNFDANDAQSTTVRPQQARVEDVNPNNDYSVFFGNSDDARLGEKVVGKTERDAISCIETCLERNIFVRLVSTEGLVLPPESFRMTTASELEALSWNNALADRQDVTLARQPVDPLRFDRLNAEQRRCVRIIANDLDARERAEASPGTIYHPLILHIEGEAGTGKTEVIRAVQDLFAQRGKSEWLCLAALTGVAAQLTGGMTLHHALSIPVNNSRFRRRDTREGINFRLAGNKLSEFQRRNRQVRYLVIDEKSLLSDLLVGQTSLRGQELGPAYDHPFGRLTVIFVGDSHQLPPPKAKSPYEAATPRTPEINAIGARVWRSPAEVVFLREQHRQCAVEDQSFRDCLSRLRVGRWVEADVVLLQNRLLDDDSNICGSTILCATRAHVHKLNAAALSTLCRTTGLEEFKFRAQDRGLNRSTGGQREEVAGLATSLEISIGARVLLVRNLAPHLGLCNGAAGNVIDILFLSPPENRYVLPAAVLVQFDRCATAVAIPPLELFDDETRICRKQVPLALGYASTIHKAIGLSLDRVLADLASIRHMPQKFGLAYTAVSRCTTLARFHVLRPFDASVLGHYESSRRYALVDEEEQRLETLARASAQKFPDVHNSDDALHKERPSSQKRLRSRHRASSKAKRRRTRRKRRRHRRASVSASSEGGT